MTARTITSDELILVDAPAIPGLSFRRFRGEEDYSAMLEAINAAKAADHIERSDTLEDIRRNYEHLTNCDLYQDVLFAEIDGKLVAYSRLFWLQEVTGERIYTSFAFVRPEWRRKGLGRAMLHENERRLLEIATGHPVDGPRYFQSWAQDTETGNAALLLSEGYQPIRRLCDMVRPDLENIPPVQIPAGLEVRPCTRDHARQVWDASQEAFIDHWGYVRESEEEYQKWLEDPFFDPSLWRVAWDGDEVAGMVLSFINFQQNEEYGRKRGYTENIAVRRPWRKRGLARSLIYLSLQAIKERGMTEAALGVDTENISGALRLYESVGFRPVKSSTVFRKDMPVPEEGAAGS